MLKIGEFARICHTGVQTIRFYDQEGILRADYVDAVSGYRYYKPGKLADYRRIVAYKDAGFTLDEIKQLLRSTVDAQALLFDAKRKELLENKDEVDEKLRRLDSLTEKNAEDKSVPSVYLPLFEQITSEFADDPDVIGRWELMGYFPLEENPASADWTERLSKLLPPDDEAANRRLFRTITFLPQGCSYWLFFWNRGILYTSNGDFSGYCLANPYEIQTVNEQNLMLLKLVDPRSPDPYGAMLQLIYRQIDRHAYNEMTVRLMRDDVSLPFIPDDRILGKWIAVDFVASPKDFLPSPPSEPPKEFFYTTLTFYERGICYREIRTGSGIRKMLLSYTSGAVLNRDLETAEHYSIRTINGVEYLFIEHKSGDYTYGGIPPQFYVFRKEEPLSADNT